MNNHLCGKMISRLILLVSKWWFEKKNYVVNPSLINLYGTKCHCIKKEKTKGFTLATSLN